MDSALPPVALLRLGLRATGDACVDAPTPRSWGRWAVCKDPDGTTYGTRQAR